MSKAPTGGFPPAVTLLYGRKGKQEVFFDEYLALRHLKAIRAAVAADADAAVSEFEAAEADLADVLDEVSTPALWGKNRLIILRDAQEFLSPAAGDRARLAPFVVRMTGLAALKEPPGRLVLIAGGLAVKDGGPHTGFQQADLLIAAIETAGGLCSCVPPFERELKAALVKAAAAQGAQLTAAAADALVAMVGADQMALHEELDKLLAHVSGRKIIAPEDVEEVSAERPETNVFALAEKILDRDAGSALSTLADLMRTPATRAEAFIIASMAATFRRYLASALATDRGMSRAQAAQQVGVPPRFQKDYIRRLERWDSKSLLSLLDRALQCDVEVKTGMMGEEAALETFVADACAARFTTRELAGRWLYEA